MAVGFTSCHPEQVWGLQGSLCTLSLADSCDGAGQFSALHIEWAVHRMPVTLDPKSARILAVSVALTAHLPSR